MTHKDLHYEFGSYRLDPSKRIRTPNGEGIPLTPKGTEILLVLVKHAGQLVEKDELLEEVWPDTFVEEANLSQNIFVLRRALGDDRTGPKYIETVARRRCRFIRSITTIEFVLAEEAIDRAVKTLELTDGAAAFAESLMTAGVVAVRQGLYGEPKKEFRSGFQSSGTMG
jgi:DNA-binding winged helix-turn-helix (wHTH) protein